MHQTKAENLEQHMEHTVRSELIFKRLDLQNTKILSKILQFVKLAIFDLSHLIDNACYFVLRNNL
jgi:short-subunit dehydrogenase